MTLFLLKKFLGDSKWIWIWNQLCWIVMLAQRKLETIYHTFYFLQESLSHVKITETKMLPFWRPFRLTFSSLQHWKLSRRRLPVHVVTKRSSKWRHFRFSGAVFISIPTLAWTLLWFETSWNHENHIEQEKNLVTLHQSPSWGMWIIKSPQSGVTLCFQFVSAASAAATTFASHVKTVWAKP